uniref:Uncharacterized protein n=1 Tax=Nelumbo nucifera TaxID=4432 RepID=A0A822YJM9_NELNU|nr:TPA_asm: hypothetical protein HUJ06_010026 [Nelumbo nucifera]
MGAADFLISCRGLCRLEFDTMPAAQNGELKRLNKILPL